jgi:catechol 2,3-dioxygenase-like lactoylglutathione lyase family enzyme
MTESVGVGGWPAHLPVGAVRVVRWSSRYEETVRFYRDVIGLPELETFAQSYGLDGTILGLPGIPAHLEIVRLVGAGEAVDAHAHLDELVLYLPDTQAREAVVTRLASAGLQPVGSIAYWVDNGGVTFLDPDGHRLVLTSWVYSPG